MLASKKLLLLLQFGYHLIDNVYAAATWPSPAYDEVEDIMLLNTGFNARNFMIPLSPCTFAPNPGHSVSGGFLRTAFHDMAGANVETGTNGVDASIGFELDTSVHIENTGPAFNNSLTFYSRFYNSRASMADLIALGAYAAVRACGGPIVPLKVGRIDATQQGIPGVPDPKDDVTKLTADFERMGLSTTEGIQLVACGHTLGGVHSAEHPTFVPPGSTELGVKDFDATNNTFDHLVITEYLDGTTQSPLVVGPDVDARSDLRVFDMDGNETVSAMADADAFANTCSIVIAKMLDTVPVSVTLTDVITPYPVKPGNLQLNVAPDGENLIFSGQIRIWTNDVPKASILTVTIAYKNNAENDAGTIDASTVLGDAKGLDDTFTFFGFNDTVPAKTSISSFVVVVTLTSGSVTTYDNNGNGFEVDDTIFAQTLSSSLGAADTSGIQQATVVAAVRAGTSGDVDFVVSLINKMAYNTLPSVSMSVLPMSKVCGSKYYDFYSASFGVPAAALNFTKYDVSIGSSSDSFNRFAGLPATAAALPCAGGSMSTTTSASSTSSSTWPTNTDGSISYTTTVVTSYETYCPFPTAFTQNGKLYTVTSETTMTITDCPCTLTLPWDHASPEPAATAWPSTITVASSPVVAPSGGSPVAPQVATFTGAASTLAIPAIATWVITLVLAVAAASVL